MRRSSLDNELVDFYSALYKYDAPDIPPDLEGLIGTIITEEDNAQLILVLDGKEIWEVLKQMHPDKAPGQDGMTTFFFRHFWDIVGNDVIASVQDFFY